jgi:hypothetical protein
VVQEIYFSWRQLTALRKCMHQLGTMYVQVTHHSILLHVPNCCSRIDSFNAFPPDPACKFLQFCNVQRSARMQHTSCAQPACSYPCPVSSKHVSHSLRQVVSSAQHNAAAPQNRMTTCMQDTHPCQYQGAKSHTQLQVQFKHKQSVPTRMVATSIFLLCSARPYCLT